MTLVGIPAEVTQPHCIFFFFFSFLSIFHSLCCYGCPNFSPSARYPSSLWQSPHPLSSCPWVVHVNSLASPFFVLFLTSLCLFCTYQLCFLFPVPFPLFSTSSLPADNPLNNLYVYDFVPVLVVCFVWFFDSVVDSCEFVVILMFIVLIFFLVKFL